MELQHLDCGDPHRSEKSGSGEVVAVSIAMALEAINTATTPLPQNFLDTWGALQVSPTVPKVQCHPINYLTVKTLWNVDICTVVPRDILQVISENSKFQLLFRSTRASNMALNEDTTY